MAGVSGLEPELAASKTGVLPLHYTPTVLLARLVGFEPT